MEVFTLKFFLTLLHLIGVAVGLGGALYGDKLFFSATKNRVISRNEYMSLKKTGQFVWWGLIVLIISGIGLFLLDPARYMASSKFISKMAIVAVIAINGAVFHGIHFKALRRLVGVNLRDSRMFRKVISS